MEHHKVICSDGRALTVVEGGDPAGKPVFYLHGTPASAKLYGPHVADAAKKGIRLIGYDRPGYGGSSPMPGRRVADAAKDVESIADSLGLDRFAVWGVSGGGPHSIACAALLRGRVVAAASLASPAPRGSQELDWSAGMGKGNVDEFGAALLGPGELDRFLQPQWEQVREGSYEGMMEAFETLLPAVDVAAMSGGLGEFIANSTKEGVQAGYEGWKEDDLAFVSDWGFSPSSVSVPMLLLQGRQDKMVPFAHGVWISGQIPGVDARLSDEDGHLTLFGLWVPEVHAWLLKRF